MMKVGARAAVNALSTRSEYKANTYITHSDGNNARTKSGHNVGFGTK